MKATSSTIKTARKLWRPKLPELPSQCASCPFKKDNDKEFGAIVGKLRKAAGITGKVTDLIISFARFSIMKDLKFSGDFACHGTAYDDQCKPRPRSEHRQCSGATHYFKCEKS